MTDCMGDDNSSNTAKAFTESQQQQSQSESEEPEWTEVTFTPQKASSSTAASEHLEKGCAQKKAVVPAVTHWNLF